MANINDVAKRAGVSKTLVSRVINNKKGVSEENRKKITAAIEELGYRPNELARSLVLRRTKTIGVVFDGIHSGIYLDLIKGMEEGSISEGLNIVFSSSKYNADIQINYLDFFVNGRSDGIIIYGCYNNVDYLKRLSRTGFPFVLTEYEIPGYDVNNVLVDNFNGAYKGTEHLIKLGHKKILHFTGDRHLKVSIDRLNGYLQAIHDNGIKLDDDMVVHSRFYERSGYENMKTVLDKLKRPFAVFCGSDAIAYGAIRAIYERGLKIPEDVAIVGFDDVQSLSTDICFPSLTTVKQPFVEIGTTSVKLLSKAIKNPNKKAEKILLNTELIVRKTCGV